LWTRTRIADGYIRAATFWLNLICHLTALHRPRDEFHPQKASRPVLDNFRLPREFSPHETAVAGRSRADLRRISLRRFDGVGTADPFGVASRIKHDGCNLLGSRGDLSVSRYIHPKCETH